MLKKILILSLCISSCTFAPPNSFSEEALNDTMVTLDETALSFKEVLKAHQGKKVLVNVWASWCRDCIVSLPKLSLLQANNPDISYVFISADRTKVAWKRALKKYKIKGTHYFMENGMHGGFGDFLNSNWIPRYLVLSENGFVDLFKAKKITDPRIANALKK